MEPTATDETVIAAFERDGVVCIRQVLDPAEVVAAAAAIDTVLAWPGPRAQVASAAGDPGVFVEDFCRREPGASGRHAPGPVADATHLPA